jgi:hypothetical protein
MPEGTLNIFSAETLFLIRTVYMSDRLWHPTLHRPEANMDPGFGFFDFLGPFF